MTRMQASALAGILAAVCASQTSADNLKPEEQIQTRQAGYAFMGWNMGRIKANLQGEYNQQVVQASANAIDAIANSGMGALYGPGTDKNVGDVKTSVKPELFENIPEVARLSKDLSAASKRLAGAAAQDDKGAVQAAFADVGKACKACHDQFRQK